MVCLPGTRYSDPKGTSVIISDDRSAERKPPPPQEQIPSPDTGIGIGARQDPDTFEPAEGPD